MEVQTMVTGDEALCLEDVLTQLVDVTGSTREVACRLDTARHRTCLYLETLHVVGLPAVEREVEVLQLVQHFFCVNANGGIALFGNLIRISYEFFFHVLYCFSE